MTIFFPVGCVGAGAGRYGGVSIFSSRLPSHTSVVWKVLLAFSHRLSTTSIFCHHGGENLAIRSFFVDVCATNSHIPAIFMTENTSCMSSHDASVFENVHRLLK